jgi:hypothetical protein
MSQILHQEPHSDAIIELEPMENSISDQSIACSDGTESRHPQFT